MRGNLVDFNIKLTKPFDQDKFLEQFYPANPFANSVLIEASQVPIEVFKICVQADVALEATELVEQVTVTDGSKILVQLDNKWIEGWLQRKRIIHGYIYAAVWNNTPGLLQKYRKQILESEDPQLHQDLIEADEVLNFVPGIEEIE